MIKRDASTIANTAPPSPDDMLADLQQELETTFGCQVTKVFFGGPPPTLSEASAQAQATTQAEAKAEQTTTKESLP